MSKNNGQNGNGIKEATIVCRKKRCGKKIKVKVGKNNDGSCRIYNCPACGTTNVFSVDENGKVHGPAAY